MTNDKNLTHEQFEKTKATPNAAALLTLAQENGIEMTAEQAEELHTKLHTEVGAFSDDELDKVIGGGMTALMA